AIDYLQESIRANVNNQRQKALSYYKIGQIHFYDLQDYNTAQVYYDSAATSINKDAPEYQEITTLAKTLKDYITQLNTIQYQDSMLHLASLPKEEVDKIVDVLVKEEEKRKKEELARQLADKEANQSNDPFFNPLLQNQQQQRNRNQNQGSGGTWYFDNPGSVSNGRIQFQQVWGNRQNADHWRRSNKTSVAIGGVGTEGESGGPGGNSATVDSTLLEKYGENYKYYVDIPDTEERKEESLTMIEEALYKLGQIYSQRLNEPDSAIKTFNTLLDRFEESEYALRTRYALFKLYSEKRDKLARVHRSIIINEYPKTIYAYLILGKDPNELKQTEEDFIYAYEGLFNAYADKQYETSLGFSEYLLAQSTFNDNPNIDLAKLHYIRGMSYGFTGEKDSLKNILTRVVNTYPEHEVTPIAQKTLNYINNGIPEDSKKPNEATGLSEEAATDPKRDPENPAYRGFTTEVKPTDKIFVLMYVRKEKISKADATKLIQDFNKKSFPQNKFKVFAFLYKQSHLLPYISTFKSIEEATNYVNTFRQDESSSKIISSSDEKVFYISHSNFKIAYGQKRMADYINYYEYIINKK
ncbi:MAG: tetratricopeptide repeat protein, partial [Bacteroidota bacterium]